MATLTSDRPAAVNAAAAARSTEDKSGPSARLAALLAARRCVTGLIVGRCAYHDPMAEDREFCSGVSSAAVVNSQSSSLPSQPAAFPSAWS